MASVEEILRELERLRDQAKNMPGQLPFLYPRLIALQDRAFTANQGTRLYRLKALLISDMEPSQLAALEGCDASPEALHLRTTAAAREAVRYAEQSGDLRLEATAQRTLGLMCRRAGKFLPAAQAYRAGIALYDRPETAHEWVDEQTRLEHLEALVRLTGIEIMLGNFAAARKYLDQAVELRQRITKNDDTTLEFGQLSWMQAMILRPDALLEALTAAEQAEDSYTASGPSMSLNRICHLTLDIALDLAEESDPAGTGRKAYIETAKQYLAHTQAALEQTIDPACSEMIKWSAARLRRLEHPSTKVALNQVRAVVSRIDTTRKWDLLLRIDAYTALGRELLARVRELPETKRPPSVMVEAAELEAEARAVFEQAVDLSVQAETPGAAWIARKTLAAWPFAIAPVALVAVAAPVSVAI